MRIRVHELAKELGFTSKDVLVACADLGEFVKSASSTLPPGVAQEVRQRLGVERSRLSASDYGASVRGARPAHPDDDGGFAAAYVNARRSSRPKAGGPRVAGEIERAIYRYAIDPSRVGNRAYTPEQRDRAERLTKQWASTWLDDIVDWIKISRGAHPDIAVKLSQAGLSAGDAGLRLGFGRIDPTRDTMFERVVKGTIGIKDAVLQVQGFRRTESETGS